MAIIPSSSQLLICRRYSLGRTSLIPVCGAMFYVCLPRFLGSQFKPNVVVEPFFFSNKIFFFVRLCVQRTARRRSHSVIPGDQILAIMLGNKCVYPLSHLTLAHEIGYSPDWPRSSLHPASASQSAGMTDTPSFLLLPP